MTGSSRRRAKWRRSPGHVRCGPGRRLLLGSSPDLLAVQVPFAGDEGSRLPGALEVAGGDREVRGEHRGIEVSVVLDAGLARLASLLDWCRRCSESRGRPVGKAHRLGASWA